MSASLASLAYFIAVLAAFHFFGKIVFRMLAPGIPRDAGLFIAAGISVFIALCGLLEFSQLATRSLFLVLVAAGALGQIIGFWQERHRLYGELSALRDNSLATVLAFGIFAALYAAFLVNASVWHYQFIDDSHGYLIFPERILGEGSIGRDLFNFRRIETGLTGGAYLYALFRSALEISQTRLADVGIGSACLLLLMNGWAREQGLSGIRLAIVLLVTLAVVTFSPIINNTPETVGKALLFGMLRLAFLFEGAPFSLRRGIGLGLMFFACVGLKTTYLPEASAIIAAYYISAAFRQEPIAAAANAAVAGITALICFLPWMIVSHGIAGTFWYPLLGTGTLSPDEASGIVSLGKLVSDGGRVMFLLGPAVIGTYLAWNRTEQQSKRVFYLAITLCSLVFTVLSQLKFTAFGYRYGHAGAATVMLFFLPIILQKPLSLAARGIASATVMLCILIMAQSKSTPDRWLTDGLLYRHRVVKSQEYSADQARRYRALQEAVPMHVPFVALMSTPALLAFDRNPIAVMDHAGKIGPGRLPKPDNAPEWARYLKSLGFHYVAYSYGDEAGFDSNWARHIIQDFSRDGAYSRFMVDDAQAAIDMRQTLVAFRKIGRTVYDDGKEFVVYLP